MFGDGGSGSDPSLLVMPLSISFTSVYREKNIRYPPRPIEIAPAQSSARPPVTTSRELPNPDNPAVKAKGTVNPSDNPTILPVSSTPAIER